MRPDDVKGALDALASEQPRPTTDAAVLIARGRRRVVQRRLAFIGMAAVLIAAVVVVGTISVTRHDSDIVSTIDPGPATPRASSQYPTALEGWKCGNQPQYTNDGGETWRKISLPAGVRGDNCTALPGGNAWLSWPTGVDFTDWHLLRIRNLTDMQVFSLPPVPAADPNTSLTFVDSDHGWFVTGPSPGNQSVYRTTDGGATWTLASKRAPISWGPVFADSHRGWSLNGRGLVGTTDGGITWKTVAVPAPAGARKSDVAVLGIAAVRDSVVVWSGTLIRGSQYRTFFDVSDDGGKTWSLRAGPSGFELPNVNNNVFSATDGSHWALASGPELRITDDAGRTWQSRPDLPVERGESLAYPMAFPTPDVGWITTQAGVKWRTTDSGRTWTNITDGGKVTATTATTPATTPIVTQAIPIGLAFVSPTEGWICGDPPSYSANGADTSWQFTDNWHTVAGLPKAPAVDVQQPLCAAVPGGDAWFLQATATPGRPVVVHVHNGQHDSSGFSQLVTDEVVVVVDITFIDADHGWALSATRHGVASRNVYATRDGGQTWSVIDHTTPVTGSMHFTSANDGWATGRLRSANTPTAGILHTTDGGRTWDDVALPAPPGDVVAGFGMGIGDLVVGPDAIVALGSKPTGSLTSLFFDVSTDGGRTWALHSAPKGVFGTTEAMTFGALDADHWQFAAENKLWTTADGGNTWTQVAEFAGVSTITSVQFVTPDAGYVAGTGQSPKFSSTVALQTLDGGDSWSTIARRSPAVAPGASPVNFPGGIVGCPTHPLTAPPPGNPPPGLVDAAYEYIRAQRHWEPTGSATYPVGTTTTGSFGEVFDFQLPSCGRDTMNNAWVVEASGAPGSGGGGSTPNSEVVLSHAADGWHVFGFYH